MLRFGTTFAFATLGALLIGGVAAAKPLDLRSAEDASREIGFSVVITTSTSGIAATCEKGCAWQTTTAGYPNSEYMVGSAGVHPVMSEVRDAEAGFSFHLALGRVKEGIRARCEDGCSWRSVSAAYPNGIYRITSQGIEPVRSSVR